MTAPRPRRARLTATAGAVLLAISVGAAAPTGAAAEERRIVVQMTPALQATIQATVEDFRQTHSISGISVAVVTPDPAGADPVITTFVSGHPSFGATAPVDADTQFELGSETKAFTADVLAYLVSTGAVSLDDEVSQYAPAGYPVPEWTDPQTGVSTPITLRDLATHQSGFADVPPNFQDGCTGIPNCDNPRPGYTQTMLWDAVQSAQLLWQPGTTWLYSNWGFALLGVIVSDVLTSVPITDPPAYQGALNTTFLDELGLYDTVLEGPGTNPATPYLGDGRETFRWDNTNAFSGAGGLISNARDMGVWIAAHLGYLPANPSAGVVGMADTLQPVSTITRTCSNAGDCRAADFRMGLAWQLYSSVDRYLGVPVAFKDGDTSGSSTDTLLAPSQRTGVTTLFNQGRVDGETIAPTILDLLLTSGVQPPPAPPSGGGVLPATGASAAEVALPAAVGGALLVLGVALLASSRRTRRAAAPR